MSKKFSTAAQHKHYANAWTRDPPAILKRIQPWWNGRTSFCGITVYMLSWTNKAPRILQDSSRPNPPPVNDDGWSIIFQILTSDIKARQCHGELNTVQTAYYCNTLKSGFTFQWMLYDYTNDLRADAFRITHRRGPDPSSDNQEVIERVLLNLPPYTITTQA